MGDLFAERPQHWGLRGDPWLWEDLLRHFEHTPLPLNEADFVTLLASGFAMLTEKAIDTAQPFFVHKYDRSGMSGGHIDPKFWREVAIPLLCERFHARAP